MLFKDIVGQNEVKKTLIKSVQDNRISHAQLFFGPQGSGSLPLAIAYAQYINCQNRTETDSCGICDSCIKFSKLAHPDLHFVFPIITDSSNNSKTSDDYLKTWRELFTKTIYFSENQWYESIKEEKKQGIISVKESESIIKKLSQKSYESDFKIMIIWLPERMTIQCANKLLKQIEEPYEKTILLLVAENIETILPTVLSRLQLIKFSKINFEALRNTLQTNYELPENEAKNIAITANGDFIKALNLIENKNEASFNFEKFRTFMLFCYRRDLVSIQKWINEMTTIGREKIKSFFDYSLKMIRENIMLNQNLEEITYLDTNEKEFSIKFSRFINPNNVFPIYEEFNKAYYYIERNGYNKLIFFDLALKMFSLIKMK